jgi:hypothetical protein
MVNIFKAVGAMCTWEDEAPFHRASLVLACGDGAYLKVLRWSVQGIPDGERLSLEEWQALVASGEAMAFSPLVEVAPPSWFWMLNQVTTAARGELYPLEDSQMIPSPDGDLNHYGLVVRETTRNRARLSIAGHMAKSKSSAYFQERQHGNALKMAQLAFHVSPAIDVDACILLYSSLRRLGQNEKAHSFIEMISNSYGPHFAGYVRETAVLGPLGRP